MTGGGEIARETKREGWREWKRQERKRKRGCSPCEGRCCFRELPAWVDRVEDEERSLEVPHAVLGLGIAKGTGKERSSPGRICRTAMHAAGESSSCRREGRRKKPGTSQ
eukprot:1712824-Rhodomonas_salina.2